MEIKDHPQAELRRPLENPINDTKPAGDKGIPTLTVAAVVGIILVEQPVTDRQAHGVDTGTFEPGKVVAGDKGVPVLVQPARCLGFAQFDAVGGLVGGLQPGKQTGGDPFFQQQPAAEIDAAQFAGACMYLWGRHGGSPGKGIRGVNGVGTMNRRWPCGKSSVWWHWGAVHRSGAASVPLAPGSGRRRPPAEKSTAAG